MKAVSICLLVVGLYTSGYGQQKPYGYSIVGNGGIVSNAFIVRDGFVLDSAANFTWTYTPQNATRTTYRFQYNQQGKLVSDSNLTYRSDPYLSGRFTLFKIRPRRSSYIYNEKGAVDSIAYACWVDSLWVPDTVGWKYKYSSDGKLISSLMVSNDYPRVHNYSYDGSGNLIADTMYISTFDTSYTIREYDSQNRLTRTQSGVGPTPSWNPQHWTEYQYDSVGIVHYTVRTHDPDGFIVNNTDTYLTFDGFGRIVGEKSSSSWDPEDSSWAAYARITYTYDQNGRMLCYGYDTANHRFTYTAEGNLDTLMCTQSEDFGFLGAHFVDSYGNDITLPGYNMMTKLYYRQLVTGIEKHQELPGSFALSQNYPNPFNPTTTITYEIPKALQVRLTVYDILGREVQTLVNEMKQPGRYETTFNASKLASGVYLYRLRAGGFVGTKKLLVIR